MVKDETPAEKRAREALDRVREKDKAKSYAAAVKVAMAVTAKATAGMQVIEEVLNREEIALVADVVKQPLYSARDELKVAIEAAAVVENSDVGDDLVVPDLKQVNSVISLAKKSIAMVTTIVATINKSKSRL